MLIRLLPVKGSIVGVKFEFTPIRVLPLLEPVRLDPAYAPTKVFPDPDTINLLPEWYPTTVLTELAAEALGKALLPTTVFVITLLLPLPTLILLIKASDPVTANLYPEAGVVDPTITLVPSSKIGAPVLPIVVAEVNLTT